MEVYAEKCVERHCEVSGQSSSASELAETPCVDDNQFLLADSKNTGELAPCSEHIVFKCLYLARIVTPAMDGHHAGSFSHEV